MLESVLGFEAIVRHPDVFLSMFSQLKGDEGIVNFEQFNCGPGSLYSYGTLITLEILGSVPGIQPGTESIAVADPLCSRVPHFLLPHMLFMEVNGAWGCGWPS